MATHRISAKRIMSDVRETFPNAGETKMFELINRAQVHAGLYSVKHESAKADLTTDKRRYTLDDVNSNIEVNKIKKVSIMNDDGDWIRIPRLLDNDVMKEDVT